jgi:hypothetical protein
MRHGAGCLKIKSEIETMTNSTAIAPNDTHADQWEAIETKHFARCIWQQMLPNRRTMVEMLEVRVRSGFSAAIVVKHFEGSIPRTGSSKPWPKHTGTYVYLEAKDGNSWEGLDKLLTEYSAK